MRADEQFVKSGGVAVVKREAEAAGCVVAGNDLRVAHQRDFVDVARARRDGELLRTDRGVAHAVGPHVALLAVDRQDLHVELEGQTGEIRHRKRLQAEPIEVVVRREELDVGEVLGSLEDPGDLKTVASWSVVVAARPEKP